MKTREINKTMPDAFEKSQAVIRETRANQQTLKSEIREAELLSAKVDAQVRNWFVERGQRVARPLGRLKAIAE